LQKGVLKVSGKPMKLRRRKFLHLAAVAVTLPSAARHVWAQAYPTRPARIIVGFPAGVAPDIVARVIGQALSERLGQQFIIENRPGAGSNIGAEIVVRAPPDGFLPYRQVPSTRRSIQISVSTSSATLLRSR
jgi:tripartite-type tricarboxylate transporter receptor subunit TctC